MAEAQAVTKEDLVTVLKEVVGEPKAPEPKKTKVGSFSTPSGETGEAPAADVAETETRARTLGWKPKEDYIKAGKDPSQWRDAKAFLDFGEKQTPILRDNVKTLETKVAKMEREREEERATVADLLKFRSGAEKRAHDAVLAELKLRRREAVEKGDGEAFEQAESQIADLETKKPREPEARREAPPNPVFEQWKEANKWFGANTEATETAEAYAIVLRSRKVAPGPEFLKKVVAHVRKVHPEVFADDDADAGERGLTPSVESGNVTRRSATARRSYEALPPEAKKACDKFVAKGWMTREEYVADYDWS